MDWHDRSGGLRIGGHRGDPESAPENTMAGFEAAVAAGVDYIETDVHRAADGTLVIIHDPTVDRTTNGTGAVADMTYDQLRELDAGSWFGEGFGGERIITLDEFLAWLEARAPLGAVIEAKAIGTGAELAERIERSSSRPDLAICSFLADEIAAAKAAVPTVSCVLLFPSEGVSADPVELIESCGADGADLPWQWLDGALADRMRARGLAIGGGTADDAFSVGKLVDLGADFVDSDRPRTAVPARRSLAGGGTGG